MYIYIHTYIHTDIRTHALIYNYTCIIWCKCAHIHWGNLTTDEIGETPWSASWSFSFFIVRAIRIGSADSASEITLCQCVVLLAASRIGNDAPWTRQGSGLYLVLLGTRGRWNIRRWPRLAGGEPVLHWPESAFHLSCWWWLGTPGHLQQKRRWF